ncbi:DUF397 domain-containing protein [Streptomyces sp. NPDC102365]|uniref:DUF397 domain-containing protein n=1 Tax=Streptomyces sp. NPDC102365 TaxID=3366162 RepID=UPI0037FDE077
MKFEGSKQASPQLPWRKSSYSSEEGGQCVEVAACPQTIHVRDSKDTTHPGLAVGAGAWEMFVGYAGHTTD